MTCKRFCFKTHCDVKTGAHSQKLRQNYSQSSVTNLPTYWHYIGNLCTNFPRYSYWQHRSNVNEVRNSTLVMPPKLFSPQSQILNRLFSRIDCSEGNCAGLLCRLICDFNAVSILSCCSLSIHSPFAVSIFFRTLLEQWDKAAAKRRISSCP